MRKAILGAAMTGSAIFGFAEGASAAVRPEMCQTPVYDDTLIGDSSGELRSTIGQYALNGVEVHVQVVKDSSDLEISGSGDALKKNTSSFTSKLVDECGWRDKPVLNVFVSFAPRAYSIRRTAGKVDHDIKESSVSGAEKLLIDDLRDDKTSPQLDVAHLLERINPYGSTSSTPNTVTGSSETTSDSSSSSPNIPFQKIGYGVGMIGCATALVARGKRGLGIRGDVRRVQHDLKELDYSVDEVVLTGTDRLSHLPEDDASALRQADKNLGQLRNKMNTGLDTLARGYKRARIKLWPGRDVIDMFASDAKVFGSDTRNGLRIYKVKLLELENDILTISAQVTVFDRELDKTKTYAKSVAGEGWDLENVPELLASFSITQTRIQELRESHHIDKPSSIIEESLPAVQETGRMIRSLPERRQQADATIGSFESQILRTRTVAERVQKTLAALKADYHPSCSEDIASTPDVISVSLEKLLSISSTAPNVKGVKSTTALLKSEELVASFAEVVADVDAMAQQVLDRPSVVEDARTTLGHELDLLVRKLGYAREFVVEAGDDIEPKTRQLLVELEEKAESLSTQASNQRPAYLELAKATDTTKQSIEQAIAQAQREKHEMDHLRTEAPGLEARALATLAELKEYAARHQSDIRTTIGKPKIPDSDTTMPRQHLRKQVSTYQEALNSIATTHEAMKKEVRTAEAERERQRRKRQEEEAARQRRAAQSYSSSPSYGDGGGYSGGFGGGGSDSSGTF